MRRRVFALLATLGSLAACAGPGTVGRPPLSPGFQSFPSGQGGAIGRVAILLPLTGQNAGLGQDLLKAAQLALGDNGPALDPRDTGSTPESAANAARAAVAARDEIIIGPLTSAETAAAAAVANGTPMLAFTSDLTQARPGVWTMGITADQQVRHLVEATQAQGKSHFAAALPDNPFGTALADALTRAATDAGNAPPAIRRYAGGFANANAALRDLSDYANRRGGLDARIKEARAGGDADGRREAADIAREPVAPAPFDALLITDPGLGPLLPGYDIAPPDVRVLGPTIWARDASNLGALAGAWYAAPDPALRGPFEQTFSAKYGHNPPALADLAFDAASIARVLMVQGGSLTRPEGFAGVDGVFALMPDGRVRRSLAIFEIGTAGPHIVVPAASALQPSSS